MAAITRCHPLDSLTWIFKEDMNEFSIPIRKYSHYTELVLAPNGFDSVKGSTSIEKWQHFSVADGLVLKIVQGSNGGIDLKVMWNNIRSLEDIDTQILKLFFSSMFPYDPIQFSAKAPSISCKYLFWNEGKTYVKRFQIGFFSLSDFSQSYEMLNRLGFMVRAATSIRSNLPMRSNEPFSMSQISSQVPLDSQIIQYQAAPNPFLDSGSSNSQNIGNDLGEALFKPLHSFKNFAWSGVRQEHIPLDISGDLNCPVYEQESFHQSTPKNFNSRQTKHPKDSSNATTQHEITQNNPTEGTTIEKQVCPMIETVAAKTHLKKQPNFFGKPGKLLNEQPLLKDGPVITHQNDPVITNRNDPVTTHQNDHVTTNRNDKVIHEQSKQPRIEITREYLHKKICDKEFMKWVCFQYIYVV